MTDHQRSEDHDSLSSSKENPKTRAKETESYRSKPLFASPPLPKIRPIGSSRSKTENGMNPAPKSSPAALDQHDGSTTTGRLCPFIPLQKDTIDTQKRDTRNALSLVSLPTPRFSFKGPCVQPRFKPSGSSRSKPGDSEAEKTNELIDLRMFGTYMSTGEGGALGHRGPLVAHAQSWCGPCAVGTRIQFFCGPRASATMGTCLPLAGSKMTVQGLNSW